MAAVGTPDTLEVDASAVPPGLLAHVSTWLAGEIAPRLDWLAAYAPTPDDAADASLIAYTDRGLHGSNRPGPRPTGVATIWLTVHEAPRRPESGVP